LVGIALNMYITLDKVGILVILHLHLLQHMMSFYLILPSLISVSNILFSVCRLFSDLVKIISIYFVFLMLL
jgi:hypothetical protein